MTICVAALCDNGQKVVVASDRMLSAAFLTAEFDHPHTKIATISPLCVALSAGDALYVTDILTDSSGISNQLQNPTIQLITDEVKQRFIHVRHRLLDENLFQPRGLSFKDFYRGVIQGVPPDLGVMLDTQVQSFMLGVSLIVAGVDDSGSHIYSIEDPGSSQCFDRLGYHAIGSGHRHAILSLVTLQHDVSSSLNWTIYKVYCAKRHAEMAPGVGTATDMRVLGPDGCVEISSEILEDLSKIYSKHTFLDMSRIDEDVKLLNLGKGTEDDGKTIRTNAKQSESSI